MSYRILVTDMDNTLLNSEARISQENLEAIRAHVAGGGLFTVATGRAPAAIRIFPELLPCIGLPVVTGNGGQVVDLAAGDRVLHSWRLPEAVRSVVAESLERFPQMGAVAYYGVDGYCCFRGNAHVDYLIGKEKRSPIPATVEDSPPWNKTLMTAEHAYLLEVRAWLEPRLEGLGRTVFSEETFLEILPLGVSKGAALRAMLADAGLDPAEMVAMGDAPNDKEMLELAGLGVAVSNADPELKAVADETVVDHDLSAVACCLERFF